MTVEHPVSGFLSDRPRVDCFEHYDFARQRVYAEGKRAVIHDKEPLGDPDETTRLCKMHKALMGSGSAHANHPGFSTTRREDGRRTALRP